MQVDRVNVDVSDTTGAGDMYAAGLSWKQAGHLGSHAAARIVAQLGARLYRRFTREEIDSSAGLTSFLSIASD